MAFRYSNKQLLQHFSRVQGLASANRDLIKVCEFAIEKCTTLDKNAERIMKSLSIVYLDCYLSL